MRRVIAPETSSIKIFNDYIYLAVILIYLLRYAIFLCYERKIGTKTDVS